MVALPLAQQANRPDPIQQNSYAGENRVKVLTVIAIFIPILLWASTFPAIRIALVAYTPTEVALLRYIVASIVLSGYAVVKQMPMPRLQDFPLIALCGFTGFTLYNVMLNTGEMTVSAGVASFIISSQVAIIALLAWFLVVMHSNAKIRKCRSTQELCTVLNATLII